MKKLNNDKAKVNYWVDGEKYIGENYDISNYSNNDETPQFSTMGWTSCMQDCLAGKGGLLQS